MGAEQFLEILRPMGMANPNEVVALTQETPRLLNPLANREWSSSRGGSESIGPFMHPRDLPQGFVCLLSQYCCLAK